MANRQTRRAFLTTLGAMSAATVAGCTSNESPPVENATDSSTTEATLEPTEATSEPTETRTPQPEGPGELLDDFEDLDRWAAMVDGGDVSADTGDPYVGSQSALIEATADADYAGAYRSFDGGIDLDGTNLSFAIEIAEPELLDLTVQLLAPDLDNAVGFRRTLTGPTDRWVRVDLGVNGLDGEPDLGNVREIRVVGRRRDGDGDPIEFRIDDLRAAPRPDSGAVMFVFDASLESHYETAFPLLEEYGFAGVETVIPEAIGNDDRLTVGQMREMHDGGWEMIARPRTGSRFLHEYSADEQREMIERTKSYLVSKGFADGARHFFTPKNVLGPKSLDIVSEFHDLALRFGGAPNGLPVTDPYNLGHFSGAAGSDTELFVDHAARHKQLAVLQFERIGGDGMDEDSFVDLLDHVESQDVEIVTATDLLER